MFSVLLMLIFMVLSPFLVTWLLNLPSVKTRAAAILFEKTRHQVNVKDFKIGIFPQPVIQLKQINYAPFSEQSVINVDSLLVKLNGLKLLQGKFIIEQIMLSHPEIGPSFFKFPPAPSDSSPRFLPAALDVESIFEFLPTSQEHIEIVVKKLASPYFQTMNATAVISKSDSKIIFKSVIQNITINSSDLFSSPSPPIRFSTLEIDSLNLFSTVDSGPKIGGRLSLENVKVSQDKESDTFHAGRVNTTFSIENNEYKVDVEPFKLIQPSAVLGVTFESSQKNKISFIRFSGSEVDITRARQPALTLFGDQEVTQTLFDIVRGGDSPQIDVELKHSSLAELFDENNLALSGIIKNGIVNIPETRLTATAVYGKARVKNGVLFIETSHGKIGQSIIETGRLNIDLMNYADYPFDGEFSLDVFLPELPGHLISLLPETLLAGELSRVKNIAGQCKAGLSLSLATGSEDLIVKVKTESFSSTGQYNRIPGNIILDSVQFEYQPDRIIINNLTGTVHGNKIRNLDSVIHLKDKIRLDILSGSADIRLSNTISWLKAYQTTKNMISPVVDGKGLLTIQDLNLSGPVANPDDWQFRIKGSGSNISLTTHPGEKEIEALTLDYDLTNQSYQFNRVSFVADNFNWVEPGTQSKMLTQIKQPLQIRNGKFNFSEKMAGFQGTLEFQEDQTFAFVELSGESLENLSLKNLHIKEPGISEAKIEILPKPGFQGVDFTGRVNTKTIKKMLNPGGTWAATLEQLTQNAPLVIEKKDLPHYKVSARSFNLDTFFTGLSKAPSQVHGTSFPDTVVLFEGEEVRYKKLRLTDVDTRIRLSPDDIYIRVNSADICDLTTNGYFNLENNVLTANIPIHAQKKENIQDLFTCLLGKENFMDGRYSLECNLTSNSSPKTISRHLHGDLNFSAVNGRIYKLTLLSRILSVLNVSKVFAGKIPDITQKGFAYDDIDVQADIQKSLIQLKRAIVNGKDMTLIFEGIIDPLNDSLNLHCLVAPFKTVDLIIEKIPIINTLFSGRLVSVPVKITGKLSDPMVVPLHPSAVGKGLINMMTDIVKTPIRLFDKLVDDTTDKPKNE